MHVDGEEILVLGVIVGIREAVVCCLAYSS